MIALIKEINHLWEPVFPHLASHIGEMYGRRDGAVLDVGPFAGTVFELRKKGVGDSFRIASFPEDMTAVFGQEVLARGLGDRVDVVGTDPSLTAVNDDSVDLLVFRGALFFPSLFHTDLSVMYRVLRKGGVGFVGGGFGKYTPDSIIAAIGAESRDLNLRLGKIGTDAEGIWRTVRGSAVESHMEVISEGGLWVIIRK
jgi:hypothetical protein